ncbi:MAG: flagellar protein [Lachnospiraceae bacterium]|nr:flagellar protein [Lachnospiraceae bacterium]
MNVRNCRKCGKIFNYVAGPHICPACKESMEADFQKVKAYIRENKGATITQVAEDCEVEISQIQQWLREERLSLSEESGILLQCESCGAAITCGRYCEACKHKLASDLSHAVTPQKKEPEPEKRKRDSDKMRFLNK